METKVLGQSTNRLQLKDMISGLSFLIDTGADVSVIPRPKGWRGKPVNFKLYAANRTEIKVYKIQTRTIKFLKDKPLTWQFYMADVPNAILGADLLAHYKLLPDLANKILKHTSGEVFGRGLAKPTETLSINLIKDSKPFDELLRKYPSVIGITEPQPVSQEHKVYHHIETEGPPVAQKARPLNKRKLAAAKREFEKLCKLGIARPSKSPWATPIHLVEKGDSFRIVGDYRRLNACTKPDRYPVKRLTDFTSILSDTKYYSTLDLKRAFNQIAINPDDIEKTAVITPFGLFEYLAMCFGLRNAAQTFQRYADRALGDLPFAFVYIDDILIASPDLETHLEHLKIVLQRLKAFALQLNLEKCTIAKTEVSFLGYKINENGYGPLPFKVKAVIDFPKPKTVDDMRRFLGIMNFYRGSIPKAAHSQRHLNRHVKKQKRKIKR